MERKKVLVFETSKTLMRAYELVLRGSLWSIVKVPLEGRIFQSIESSAPDALIVDRRALSPETREALYSLPLPIVYCAAERSAERAERLYLARPFSSDELFETLGAALAWEPDLTADDAPAGGVDLSEEFDGDEEPMILPEPDEDEEGISVTELTDADEEDELPTPEITESKSVAMPEPEPEPESEPEPQPEPEPEPEPQPEPQLESEPQPEPEPEPEPEMIVPTASDVTMPEPTIAEQIADRVEERVAEELLPAEGDIPEGGAMPDVVRAIIRRELREVMKEYFWEEAPLLMKQILEEEIRKLAAKQ